MIPSLTIVTPTYNRRHLIEETLESAFAFIEALPPLDLVEVVVVDDCSTDDTAPFVRDRYNAAIAAGLLRIVEQERNTGAAGAKNRGVEEAYGEWIVVLDSDDTLVLEGVPVFVDILSNEPAPLLFFRCADLDSGELVGPEIKGSYSIGIREYLRTGTPGECIPVFRRDLFLKYPFEGKWRGREGWAWAQMIEAAGEARIIDTVLRRYRQSHTERISTRAGSRRHAEHLMEYHGAMLKRYGSKMGPKNALLRAAKVGYYAACYSYRRAVGNA